MEESLPGSFAGGGGGGGAYMLAPFKHSHNMIITLWESLVS